MTPDAVTRRLFLARLAALTSAAAAAPVVLPGVASAAESASTAPMPNVPVRPEAVADPTEATLAEAARLMRDRRLTSRRLVDAQLERIGAYDDDYQAFALVLTEQARAAAHRADRAPTSSPLNGIPLCIKDNFYTEGVRTAANSYVFADFVPPYDATAVERLTRAGAVVLGKGQMGPLATTRATTPAGEVTTVNAWTPTDPSVDPGGSSTGPATAVAGRMATSSIGTQTGGSITAPSNAQNLTGLKPTMGRVSLHGVIPLTFSRDHVGPLARDALDAALMLTVLAGPDEADVRTQGLPALPDLVRAATPVRAGGGRVRLRRRTRIGVPPDYLDGNGAELNARRAWLDTIAATPNAEVVDVRYPDDWSLLTGSAFNNVRLPERTEPFRPFLRKDLRLFGVSVISWLQGLLLSGDEWATGQRAKHHLLQEVLDELFAQCDVVLQTSPVPFDILGLPEIGFPIGFGADDASEPEVPIGTILGGNPYAEDRLLEVVAAYQAQTDWQWRRPADPPTDAGAAALRRARPRPRLDAVAAAALTE